jgi:Ca2+-binding EF-hand superfamily protein
MVTLVHLGNEGGGGFLYAQLIPFKPVQITCFFVTFILVVCISLMNLITAVVVEVSLDQAAQDKEAYMASKLEAMKGVMPQIAALFCELDTNGDHLVTHDEIEFAQRHVQERLGQTLEMDDLTELFEILDNDNSGELDIDEFVCGICKIVTTNSTLDQVRVEKNMSLIRKEMKDVRYYVERTEDNLRREIREVHNLLLKSNLNHENSPLLQVPQFETRLTGEALVPIPGRKRSNIVEDKRLSRFAERTRSRMEDGGVSARAH